MRSKSNAIGPDPEMSEEENDAWKHKADKKDVLALNEIKSNKFDTE
jgi:hypothetical protein